MARKKKSNGQLWVMLALIVIIIAVIVLLPSCGNRSAKGGASQSDSTTLVKVGDPAPDFSVALFDGSHLTLSELRGKVVLLNFWATWCPPCRQELTRVQKDLIDRFAGRDFLFLPVSRGEKRSDVAAFREKTGYTFPMGLDSTRTIYDRYATNFIPRNYLIDRDGRIITATIGYSPEEFDELIAAIERALAGKE
ncbi:TlpA disulfide reductase family protein [Alistipes sp. CAG:268]|jgi:peroxiredoxin|uniref:TlpA family protein disulfide reductase n=1 Tax=Alistipes sp. CAG:268 TaxID=1262693 RepID=UPI000336C5B1|nr:TlpA disulfide reductase family protein [Alistipes sp. CAG:268]CDC99762.1 peroxiredoxin [Alistipes sp. CAG:268]HBL70908.1 TlpA family protein disulfide reductase [Alistipes sp.]HBW01086.1 TlpA family protein disulfide reductase [Alistipes sp.]